MILELGLSGVLFTADALHCQKPFELVRDIRNALLAQVKANHSGLLATLEGIAATQVAANSFESIDLRSHGRYENRTLETFIVRGKIDPEWDSLIVQAARLTWHKDTKSGLWHAAEDISYACQVSAPRRSPRRSAATASATSRSAKTPAEPASSPLTSPACAASPSTSSGPTSPANSNSCVVAERRCPRSSPVGNEPGSRRDQQQAQPVGQRKVFSEEEHAEDADQNNAQFIDGSNAGGIAKLQGTKIAKP